VPETFLPNTSSKCISDWWHTNNTCKSFTPRYWMRVEELGVGWFRVLSFLLAKQPDKFHYGRLLSWKDVGNFTEYSRDCWYLPRTDSSLDLRIIEQKDSRDGTAPDSDFNIFAPFEALYDLWIETAYRKFRHMPQLIWLETSHTTNNSTNNAWLAALRYGKF
jgi:hypothetical protein